VNVSPIVPEQAPLSVRDFFSGETSPLVATLAHVPELLQVVMPFIGQQFGPSALLMRHKEMIILGVSALQGCQYCTQTHTVVAYREGLTVQELQAVRNGTIEMHPFVGKEASLWAYICVMGGGQVDLSARTEAMNALKQDWMEFEIVEMTMLIGTTIMLNRYCIALDIPTAQVHLDWLENQDWI
jgi:AhpD family alkylhydroperoxidase